MKLSSMTFILLMMIGISFGNSMATPKKNIKRPNSEFTTCQLIEKNFVNISGNTTKHKELYLQCSIQDYFIKICESKVSVEDLKPYLNQSISVKMKIQNGAWDHCHKNPSHAQSRFGDYVVIESIIQSKK